MAETKNLKQKLQEARMLLKDEELTKSGRNNFLGNNYFTLQDLQSPITKVCLKVGMCPVITFENDCAIMTIYDFDSEDTIITKTPMAEVVATGGDKKKSLMQELMSNESYARRALYIATFEIVEDDGETQTDDLERHQILMVKTRIERTMTQLMQKGFDFDEVVKKIGLDEKRYNGFLNACNTINTIEKNMQALLQKGKDE